MYDFYAVGLGLQREKRGLGTWSYLFPCKLNDNGSLLVLPLCIGYPLVDSVWYFMHILCSKSAHLLKNPRIKCLQMEIPQVPALDESI